MVVFNTCMVISVRLAGQGWGQQELGGKVVCDVQRNRHTCVPFDGLCGGCPWGQRLQGVGEANCSGATGWSLKATLGSTSRPGCSSFKLPLLLAVCLSPS